MLATPTESHLLHQWALDDFRSSGVPDALAEVNIFCCNGDEAVQIITETAIAQMQAVSSYITKPAARLMERYSFMQSGGWFAYGCTLDGKRGEVVYSKPRNPRRELKDGKLKPVKYETAPKCEALPLLPYVDSETAQKIYTRYAVEPRKGESFWQVIQRCNIPIGITEGLKKALSMLAHGLPTIAVRGIHNWHKKGSPELHEAIAHFTTQCRRIYLAFDQDEKPKTIMDVRTQALKLGASLEAFGCKVHVLVWQPGQGKGIDDAIVGMEESGQDWFDDLVKDAPSLIDYRRDGRITMAIATIERLNKLSYPIERDTQGDCYMPNLPELEQGAIHVITASMNSGKTTRIGKDWVGWATDKNWNVLVLTPLNSLGKQAAKDWGLPHIHDFATDAESQKALWSLVSADHGIVMCPDSLHRLPDWFWQRPCLLVLDEANQVISHVAHGETLGNRWADILERLAATAKYAIQSGAIVLSEDGIPDRAIRFMQELSGAAPVRVFRHRRSYPWNCTVMTGQASGFKSRLTRSVMGGDRHLVVTSSQREAKRLEKAIGKLIPSCKVVRVDSETNEQGAFDDFFEAPDQWLIDNQPDVLILSPSAKSGVSIEGGISAEDAYFKKVWGYFPALDTDTHMQLLGRYRPAVERVIFVPLFIMAGGNEALFHPGAVLRRLQRNLKGFAGVYGLGDLLDATGERGENLVQIETAVMDYLSRAKTVSGSQKAVAHDALVKRLEVAGHHVQCQKAGKDQPTVDLWKAIQEEIWQEEAEAIATTAIDEGHTPEWAEERLRALDVGLETRIRAYKVIWRAEFPGILFDDPGECYEALCLDYGAMRRGVLMQARVENLEAAKENDRRAVESILKAKIRAVHKLPKKYLQAMLLAKTGILELLDGKQYSNTDPRTIAIKKAALYWAEEIGYWLNLHIKDEQTPVEICNKLLSRLDLKVDKKDRPGEIEATRPGRRGEQSDRRYRVVPERNPIRCRLLEAARRKLSSSVSTISNDRGSPDLQIVDTAPKLPEIEALRYWWEAATTQEERAAVLDEAVAQGLPPNPELWRAAG